MVIKRKINETNNQILNQEKQIEMTKRQNMAIQQTAATLVSNYANNSIISSQIMNGNTATLKSSMKPIKIQLQKKDKKDHFGIILGCKFYVKDILEEGLASANEMGLRKGDLVLKINDLSYDHISLYQANKIISKSKETKLNLLVKRNNNQINTGSISSGSSNSIEDEEEVIDEINQNNNNNNNHNNEQQDLTDLKNPTQVQEDEIQPQAPPRRNSLQNNRMSKYYSSISNLNKSLVNQPLRTAIFARENGIGIRLAGGNKVGIFICDVQYNSPAERAGIKIADKIIKVNGVDYSQLTREEAVQHILSIQTLIEMVVSYSKEEYDSFALDPSGGDSFYVRAHFDYMTKIPNEFSFRINDILHVTDTLYNGVIGQWVATKLAGENGESELRGVIPNQSNAEQLVQNAKTIEQTYLCTGNNTENIIGGTLNRKHNLASLGASARMSIRKRLGKNNASVRSKSVSHSDNEMVNENQPYQSVKVIKPNTYLTDKYPAYEKVQLKEINFIRPVVIFGPLADVAREKLKSESPQKYEIPDSYSTNPNDPQNQQTSGVIKLASIREIIENGRHCLLDITPNAVDHLNYAQYFPICIYLKSNSRNHTKELRQKYAKNLKAKSSRRLYENAMKLENYYSHLFTGTVQIESNQWFKKVKELIDQQQSQPLWISQDALEPKIQQQQQQTQVQPNCSNQFLNKQNNQLIFSGSASTPISANSKFNSITNNHLFDDNFELPIYTSANHVLSMSGAASSTYSLYEENYNNRSSLAAASDTDLNNKNCGSETAAIYSTNFKTNNLVVAPAIPVQINHDFATSSPSLSSASSSNVATNHRKQGGTENSSNSSSKSWKKFATYSANSFKNFIQNINGTTNDNNYQQQNEEMNAQNQRSTPPPTMINNISKPILMENNNNMNNNSNTNNYAEQYIRRLSSSGMNNQNQNNYNRMFKNTSMNYENNNMVMQAPTQPPPPLPHHHQFIHKQLSNGSLLQPINNMNNSNGLDLIDSLGDLKLQNNKFIQRQQHQQHNIQLLNDIKYVF